MKVEQNVLDFKSLDDILHESLKNGDTLTTPQESQMLINLTGVSINTKPRSDGRYQGYVSTPDGNKQYFYGKTREEVAAKIKSYLQEAKTPKRKKTKKELPYFGEYVKKWIEIYKKPNLKPVSLAGLEYNLKPALTHFADCKIDKISTDDIQEMLLSIKGERSRDICNIYVNEIFRKAVKSGLIKFNPCDGVEIKRYSYKRKKGLTIDEQATFLKAIENSKYKLLYTFLLSTGLRIGEALALKQSDIDYKKHTVTVSKDVVFIKGQRIEQLPKTEAANRTVPISESLCEQLSKIKSEILFPYAYSTVNAATNAIAKQTGIKVSLHILRHTYSNRLEEAGIPPKVKQYLLGHTKLDVTQNVYTDTQEAYVNTYSDNIRKLF